MSQAIPLEGSAIVLAASTEPGVITAGTTSLNVGATLGVANIQNLRNPLDVPMLVDEILFYTSGGGADVRVGLKLGSDEIIKQYTPLILLGASRNLSVSSASNVGPTPVGAQINQTLFGMRMSSDLILYPSEFLNPIFYNAGIISAAAQSVRIIVRGRAMKLDSKRQSLPWISYWAGQLQSLGSNLTEETVESDLFNPYDVSLQLDRMVGAIASTETTGGASAGVYSGLSTIDAGLNYALLRMVDGTGAPIIRDFTPFSHIFQMMDYSWRLRGTMPPHSFWKAYMQENYSTTNFSVTSPKLQLMMSLIGHRAVRS